MASLRGLIQIFRRGIPDLSTCMGVLPRLTPRIYSFTAFIHWPVQVDKLLSDSARLRKGAAQKFVFKWVEQEVQRVSSAWKKEQIDINFAANLKIILTNSWWLFGYFVVTVQSRMNSYKLARPIEVDRPRSCI